MCCNREIQMYDTYQRRVAECDQQLQKHLAAYQMGEGRSPAGCGTLPVLDVLEARKRRPAMKKTIVVSPTLLYIWRFCP